MKKIFMILYRKKLGEANKFTGLNKNHLFIAGLLFLEMQFECTPYFSFSTLILRILIQSPQSHSSKAVSGRKVS